MAGRGSAPVSIINWSCFITLILLFSIIDLSKTSIRSEGVFCCENLCTLGNILTAKRHVFENEIESEVSGSQTKLLPE